MLLSDMDRVRKTDDFVEDELQTAVSAAIEQWKRSRRLAQLSANDCAVLNRLITSGFQSVLFQRSKAFDKRRTEEA